MSTEYRRTRSNPGQSTSCYLVTLLLLCAACASTQAKTAATATPTPTSSPSPTRLATPTSTPTPTATPSPTCDLLELWPGQHISASVSYTETQTSAAGPMVCRIERNSCSYRYLIGNLDPGIIFKGEEEPPYNEEDILMHPAMLLPLYRLSELVRAEWGGAVRLRVTDAYDSLLEHDLGQPDENHKNSLHFEGRAIDLTTWPVDPVLYGRLCALAHCAGFAWVHNEGDHCHAAIKAESLCLRCSNN